MMRSLWFKLSVAFTVISIVSITVLGVATSLYFEHRDFNRIVHPETIAGAVSSTHLLFAEAVKHPESDRWLDAAQKAMIDDILNMTSDDGEFHIGFASDPEVYYRVYDGAGRIFFQSPKSFSKDAAETFALREAGAWDGADEAVTLGEQGLIWVRQVLEDGDGQRQGRIDVLLNAEFAVWKLLRGAFSIDTDDWLVFILAFSVVGLMCGIAANLFVTRKLRVMNQVASAWSAGDFALRIPVGEKSSDIFAEHSRMLNGMAGELETLVDLRQKAAVTLERNRVARELHDTVKQNLFALKLQLVAARHKIDGSPAEAHVEEAQRITREAQQDILSMLTQLGPSTSDERGFYGRLVALSEDMTRRYGVVVVWMRKEPLSPAPVEEQALLRIAQEAMNNSVRHGAATTIALDAFSEGGMRHLHIVDNGSGLPDGVADARLSGMGLTFMRERARDLPEGDFAIAGNEKGGATVRISWREV